VTQAAPDVVTRLGDRVIATLARTLAGVSEVALVDFPNHMNIGDAAIWLGELRALRTLGVRIAYTCDQRSYVPAHLERALAPDGAILLHGGGNFGDLYPRHQRLRERVLADFRQRLTVQLPQTLAYAGAETEARLRALVARHERLHVLARDELTEAWFRERLYAPVELCPDSALCLGPQPAVGGDGVLWLARRDDESKSTGAEAPPGIAKRDWPGERGAWRRRRLASRLLSYATSAEPHLGALLHPLGSAAFPRLAAERVGTGLALIGSARAVVTDRLHAHIFALLCGVPHVVLDNTTGKLRTFYETWTSESPIVHWADDEPAAFERALALAAA
jgi:exopolysaccharide biosynthesis predicted pyruvyltransferase EpsI